MKKNKIGRNSACPCGSGIKYKKCHGRLQASTINNFTTIKPKFSSINPDIMQKIAEYEAKDKKRILEQGKVRPIISTNYKGYKVVAVGNQVCFSKEWKTFHDFLFDYIKNCLGSEWGNSELKKDFNDRHPILQWYKGLCDYQKKIIKIEGEVYSALMTGEAGAYLFLAYDLFLLKDNTLLQERLIKRLKVKEQFQGARYELFVTASFIKAGFEIKFEDETDRSKSHCEFVATHKLTGKKYSVEAKSRHRSGFLGHPGSPADNLSSIRLRIGKLINEALKKEANHTRIIFLDINMPPVENINIVANLSKQLDSTISKIKNSLFNGKPCPPAYLFYTNRPYHYVGKEEPAPSNMLVIELLNMPNFKINSPESIKAIDSAIYNLWESVNMHSKVPHEFE